MEVVDHNRAEVKRVKGCEAEGRHNNAHHHPGSNIGGGDNVIRRVCVGCIHCEMEWVFIRFFLHLEVVPVCCHLTLLGFLVSERNVIVTNQLGEALRGLKNGSH